MDYVKLAKDIVIICIPTKRPPPIRTLESYPYTGVRIVVVASPETYEAHKTFYSGHEGVTVEMGVVGMMPQVIECYKVAHALGYPHYFRMDDDLAPQTFVGGLGHEKFPGLLDVIAAALEARIHLQTSLVGFSNSSNRSWLGEGYGRTYGLIHGGAHLCDSSDDPIGDELVFRDIVRYEDVYRSCSHRKQDGAVGRVKWIGVNKKDSASTSKAGTSIVETDEDKKRDIEIILSKFPDFVTCQGLREAYAGGPLIANWRFKRHNGYKK